MTQQKKVRIYFSLESDLLDFVQERSDVLGITRTGYISNLLQHEFNKHQKVKIDKIIEGTQEDY